MTKTKKLLALLGISLLSFTGYLDSTIVSTALSTIQSQLHMSVTELQWIMNAFFLGISAFMASMGRVADIHGRRKVFYLGTFIFGLASIGAGLATKPFMLIVCRAVQGITTAITIPVGITLIQNLFEPNEMAKAMGIFGSITGAGLALGPVVGGALVSAFGWPAVFLVNIPFILVGMGMCLFTIQESRSQIKMNLDYWGIVFLVLTTGSLVFAVVEANNYGWTSPIILGSFSLFFVSLILLINIERKTTHPLLSATLFKNRVFLSCILFAFTGGGLMSVILFADPLYLNLIAQKSVFVTGLLLFIMPLVVMTASPFIGHLNHRLGPRLMMICGAVLYILTVLSQLFFAIQLNYPLLIISYIVFGLAWAIVTQAPVVALGQALSEKDGSVAIGALFSFYNIGAAVMLALGTLFFHAQALTTLQQEFIRAGWPTTSSEQVLLNQFVNEPDKMPAIISQLHNPQHALYPVFQQAFMGGMHAMYWLLLLLAFASLISIILMRKIIIVNDNVSVHVGL